LFRFISLLESIMQHTTLTSAALERSLNLRDLANPEQGIHAMQQLIDDIHRALAGRWCCRRLLYRASPLVSVEDNYNRLGYPADGASRDARYTRYVTQNTLLRTQTSAMIPRLLRTLSVDPLDDVLLICPGLVYRRDTIDRLHTGEPHQLDLWRICKARLTHYDLADMIRTVVSTALPDHHYRLLPAVHPYTENGWQIDVRDDTGQWIEIGECGMASPRVLADAGLDTRKISGLAMGLGLDRILMLRKGIDDIRLLRSEDSRIARQMLDLDVYKPVSDQPPMRRDLSVAIDGHITAEEIGDLIREAMVDDADLLESVDILSQTDYLDLPASARIRMGMQPDQKNVLLRLVIRHPVRTLTHPEANTIRDRVYRVLHRGSRIELAAS
jgi:phenylalanyl-tRNA synthetase alpha chain